MRELSFRIWDKRAKCWISGIKVFIGDGYASINKGLDNNVYIVQQFTGLFDVIGQPIYEGDILQAVDHFDGSSFGGAVVYNTELASYLFGNDKYYISTYEVKIIGNIFENPELLEN